MTVDGDDPLECESGDVVHVVATSAGVFLSVIDGEPPVGLSKYSRTAALTPAEATQVASRLQRAALDALRRGVV